MSAEGPDAAAVAAMAALAAEALGPAAHGWGAADLAAMVAAPGAGLARDDHGFALWRVLGDEAELLLIAVAAARRRQGHGAALLARAEAGARAAGARRMILEVAEDNAAAGALYHRAGYAVIGVRPGYYTRPGGAVAARVLARPI